MIPAAGVLIALSALISPAGPLLAGLAAVLALVPAVAGDGLGGLALFVLLGAVPAALTIAGLLLDRYCAGGGSTRGPLPLLGLVLAGLLLFQGEFLFRAMEIAQRVGDSAALLALVVAAGSAALFVGSVTALSLMSVSAVCEGAVAWVFSAGGRRVHFPWLAARHLLILALLGLTFQLILGLVVAELSPDALIEVAGE